MARVVDPRALADRTVTIPGLKPSVREFRPTDSGDPQEVDAFIQMVRKLRRQTKVVSPGTTKQP
jgi:hypothetical protein